MNAPLIATRGLYKRFGAVVAVDNVTVEITPGETVGIIGANGAGKTTFVNIVTGYLKPDEGVILFRGVDITAMPPREVTRLGIRRSFQVAQLFPNLSVRDNVLVALACAEQTRPTPTTILRTPARLTQANKNSCPPRDWGLCRSPDARTAAGPTQAARHRACDGGPLRCAVTRRADKRHQCE